MKALTWSLVAALFVLLCALPVAAQYQIDQQVLGSGGTDASGGSYEMKGTVGQPLIGEASGGSYANEMGFWYMPGWILTGVEDGGILETVFGQNVPNPFNPVTVIGYAVAQPTRVTITVYDVSGREVTRLVDKDVEPGRYEATFDARGLASGVYFTRMTAGDFTETRKLLLLK
ncbi:MAG: T9SS type A sorting domain-containing protein [Candidatus Eisenbacteria bacterium]|nr:T9SS type A sorting domain-containing protein [Candidatus Eisenbacteria bacterium]